jgi:hypothetical protein
MKEEIDRHGCRLNIMIYIEFKREERHVGRGNASRITLDGGFDR